MPEEITTETTSPLHVSESTQEADPAPVEEAVESSLSKAEVKAENLGEVIEDPEKEGSGKEEEKNKSGEEKPKEAKPEEEPEKKAGPEKKGPSKEGKVKSNSPEKGGSNEEEPNTAGVDEKGSGGGILSALLAILMGKKEDEKKKEPNAVEALLAAILNLLTSAINAVTSLLFEAGKAIQKFSGLANEEPQKLPTEGKENSNGKGEEEPAKEGPKKEEEQKQEKEEGQKEGVSSLDKVMPGPSGEVEKGDSGKSKLGGLPGMKDVVNSMKGSVATQTDGATSSPVSAPAVVLAPAAREGGRG